MEREDIFSLEGIHGSARVVIDRIEPVIDGGAFPLKRRAGELIRFTAHAIADGHDHLDIVLKYNLVGNPTIMELPMADKGNDEFEAELAFDRIGLYSFSVEAWCDRFRNWHVGFIKKSDANDPKIGVELLVGAELVLEAAERARGEVAHRLEDWGHFLGDDSRDLIQRIQLARGSSFYDTVRAFPDTRLATKSPEALLLIERPLAYFGAWYEYFPRSCGRGGRHGTFKDAQERLPEIARMGFDIVYFPPIHPIGRTFRKGRNNNLEAGPEDPGSPWAIGAEEGGHKSILPELGTLEDFKEFITRAESLGLEVAIDIAFQCAPDHPYVKSNPQWFKWRPDGTVQYAENPPKKYQDILPFDFETDDWKALWKELKSIFDYWIGVGVKVFRVDNPHTKAMEFWRWCIQSIKAEHPEVLFLSEAFTRPKRMYRLAKAGFTQGYTYFTWRNNAREMREYVEHLVQPPVVDMFIPNFWPNTPDILHEDLQKGTRAMFLTRYLLAATLSSNVGIYGPAFEVMDREPFPGKEEYNHNEKYQLKDWNWDVAGNLKPEITRINALRKEHPALQDNRTIRFVDTDNPNLLVYLKQTLFRDDILLIVTSFDGNYPQMGNLELPLEHIGLSPDQPFVVRDLLSKDPVEYTWQGSRNFVLLDPLKTPAHIFEIVR